MWKGLKIFFLIEKIDEKGLRLYHVNLYFIFSVIKEGGSLWDVAIW